MSSKEEFSILHSPNFTNLQYLAKRTKFWNFFEFSKYPIMANVN